MSSSVFFKFRSSKEPQTISFDGTGITVFELKREIIVVSGLGDGSDFDLQIFDESNPTEEYVDDTTIIPRSSSVIAKRVPAARPGHGRAARYVTGKAPVTAKNFSRTEQAKTMATKRVTPPPSGMDMSNAQSEEERMQAMFAAEGSQWEQQRAQMAHAKPIYFKNAAARKHPNSDKPLPPGYICHRCQEKGHWIQDCPTNDDPSFVPKPRLKRTTGIPKTFIRRVEKPEGVDDGLLDSTQNGQVMLDAAGNYVVVEPDKASWEKFEAKHKAATAAKQEAAAGNENKQLEERGLLCPIDKRLFVEPMKTPCCGKTYCNDCIENTLLDTDLVCPNCGQPVLIDNLVADDAMVTKIRDYEREKSEREKAAKATEKSAHEGQGASDSADEAKVEEISKVTPPPQKSPQVIATTLSAEETVAPMEAATPEAAAATSADANSKKRPASEDLDWNSVPAGPAAMRTQPSQQPPVPNVQAQPSQNGFTQMQFPFGQFPMMPNQFMPQMPGFPMQPQMPFNMNNGFGMGNMMNGFGAQSGMGGMFPMNGFGGFNGMQGMNGQPGQQFQQTGGQQGFGGGMQNGYRQFNNQQPSQQDSPYVRQPVNPRPQNKNKKARPCDYTTLS